LTKLCFFETDYDKIELKKSVMTSIQWRHRYCVRYQTNAARFFIFLGFSPNQNFLLRQWL